MTEQSGVQFEKTNLTLDRVNGETRGHRAHEMRECAVEGAHKLSKAALSLLNPLLNFLSWPDLSVTP